MEYKRDFFVCFRRAQNIRWWHIFTGRKRAHIFLISPCTDSSCVMINPSEGGIGLYCYSKTAEDVAYDAMLKGAEVIHYRVVGGDMEMPYPKLFRTCVTIAKDFLGIRCWWIVTPDQLYNELLRR